MSTIRAILYNERYTGVRTFNERRWVKIPGTNKRRPEMKDPSEVIRTVHEELRIIDEITWARVQQRLQRTKAQFTRTETGALKGRAHGAVSFYPFSSLLVCDKCSSPMTVRGGYANHRYYFCSATARGRCDVRTGVRTDVVRDRLFEAIAKVLSAPAKIALARKTLAEMLGGKERSRDADLKEQRAQLERIQGRIGNLIDVLSSGEGSPAVRDALRDMEARAKEARTSIAELENVGSNRVRLPSPDELLQKVWELEDNLRQDPIPGRELLRRFIDGDIRLTLGADGIFTAETKILPLVLLGLETQKPVSGELRPALNVGGSGGRF